MRDRHRKLVGALVEQFEGEVVEAPGDESLSLFPSALVAVDCALAIQASLRDDATLRLRIGIHLGDILRRGHELIGEGVNLAARLRPLAEPGGICVSDAVWRQVASRPHLSAQALGHTALKSVAETVEVYAVESSGSRTERPHRGRPRWATAAVVATLVVGSGLAFANRHAIVTSAVLYLPLLLGESIEQKLGMTTAADGTRIAYATTGEGPALVHVLGWATHLAEGLGSPAYDPERLLPLTSRNHVFVRYDGRGFGLSDRDVTNFSLSARVSDLEAVVDALGLERFAIYAPSAGGVTAITYTAQNPDRVTRLVLASTNASRPWEDEEKRAAYHRMLDMFDTDWQKPSVTNMFVEHLFPERNEYERRSVGEFLRRSGNGPQIAGFYRAHLELDVREDARRIRVPTLILHGRHDAAIPLEAGRQLAALVPGARFDIVEGGHAEGTGGSADTRVRILEFLDED